MTITPPIIKFECPHCQQHIEAPEAMRFSKIDCPNCGRKVPVIESAKPPPKEEPSKEMPDERNTRITNERNARDAEIARQERYKEVKTLAGLFSYLSIFALVVAGLVIILGVWSALGAHDYVNVNWQLAGSLVGLAFTLFLTAQLIHIRANTEK